MIRTIHVIFLKEKIRTCLAPEYSMSSIHIYYKMQVSYHNPKVLKDLAFSIFLASPPAIHPLSNHIGFLSISQTN